MNYPSSNISIVIPTYCRETVLVNTVSALLAQDLRAGEIILVDQTPLHEPDVHAQLDTWVAENAIKWIKLDKPSITHAMNVGLQAANNSVVLFLDDDIIPSPNLVAEHAACYSDTSICAVVGQVLQPKQAVIDDEYPVRGSGLRKDLKFHFNSSIASFVENCMAGNLSVRRDLALAAGGMDENFVGVAYRFETEFAKRLIAHSGKHIRYEPKATMNHLQAASGGTRTKGSHLNSASSDHSVGDYYYAYCQAAGTELLRYVIARFFRSVRTRYHLRRPWWIPVKLLGEWRGFCLARRLAKTGQKPIESQSIKNQ